MRGDVLDKAKNVITGERQDQYGKPEDNFENIAKLWTAYLHHNIEATDVALMMVLFKVARTKGQVYKEDNAIDACGYMAIYADLMDGRNEKM